MEAWVRSTFVCAARDVYHCSAMDGTSERRDDTPCHFAQDYAATLP